MPISTNLMRFNSQLLLTDKGEIIDTRDLLQQENQPFANEEYFCKVEKSVDRTHIAVAVFARQYYQRMFSLPIG